MKFKPCLGLLEEEGLRGNAHQCGQHFDGAKLSWKVRKTQPSIYFGLKVTTLLLFRIAI
jgi:hypothetical protein